MSREYDDFLSLYGSHNGVHVSGAAADNTRRKRINGRQSQRIAANVSEHSDTVMVQSSGSAGGNQSSFNRRDHGQKKSPNGQQKRFPNGHHLNPKAVDTHERGVLDRDAPLPPLSQSSRETLGSLPRLSPTNHRHSHAYGREVGANRTWQASGSFCPLRLVEEDVMALWRSDVCECVCREEYRWTHKCNKVPSKRKNGVQDAKDSH